MKIYWDIKGSPTDEELNSAHSAEKKVVSCRPSYEAPWSNKIDWAAVKKSADSGEALSVWLEEQQELNIISSENSLHLVLERVQAKIPSSPS